jgi:hypothetical protein
MVISLGGMFGRLFGRLFVRPGIVRADQDQDVKPAGGRLENGIDGWNWVENDDDAPSDIGHLQTGRTLSVINNARGIRITWNDPAGNRVVCVVHSAYVDANTVHNRLNGGGYVMPAIDNVRCQYENEEVCTLNQLINRLVADGMLIRYINTIELAENVVLI